MREKAGWVYAVRVRGGPTKIGYTLRDPYRRVVEVCHAVPVPTEILGFIWSEQARTLEESFHAQFSDCWVKGEWFNLCRHDIAAITCHPDFVTPENLEAVLEERHESDSQTRLAEMQAALKQSQEKESQELARLFGKEAQS